MKHLLFIIMVVAGVSVYGQQQIEYTYDPAGNRITRQVFEINQGGGSFRNSAPDPIITTVDEDLELNIFPNPVKEFVTVELKGEFNSALLSITDINGKTLEQFNVNSNIERINVTHLPKGIYIIKAQIDKHYVEYKMIKQ